MESEDDHSNLSRGSGEYRGATMLSEKRIIASMLPLDNYLMDLNSGQSYYRPTYLLVAVLKDARGNFAGRVCAGRNLWAILRNRLGSRKLLLNYRSFFPKK
jgi:hypothetical protein